MARSNLPNDWDRQDDQRALAEVLRQVNTISQSLTGYARDLGGLTQAQHQLESTLAALTRTVHELSDALRGAQGHGVLMTQELHKRALADLSHDLEELQRTVVRIDPHADKTIDWWRWGIGLFLGLVALPLFLYFAADWTATSRKFETFREGYKYESETRKWFDDDHRKRLEALERSINRGWQDR